MNVPKFSKMLVALENTALGQQVARAALEFAARLKVQVLFVHVLSPSLNPDLERITVLDREMSSGLGYSFTTRIEVLDTLKPLLSIAPFDLRVLLGEPASSLLECAKQENCDLLVLGTHAREGVSRLLLGSVAEHVMRHSALPILLLRASSAPRLNPTNAAFSVAVAVDGSPRCEWTAEVAAELALQLHSPLWVLYVLDDARAETSQHLHAAQGNREIADVLRQRGEYALALARTRALQVSAQQASTRLELHSQLLAPHPDGVASSLMLHAAEKKLSLLVMGMRDRTNLFRWLEGSNAESVVRHSPCPVLVIPHKVPTHATHEENTVSQTV